MMQIGGHTVQNALQNDLRSNLLVVIVVLIRCNANQMLLNLLWIDMYTCSRTCITSEVIYSDFLPELWVGEDMYKQKTTWYITPKKVTQCI